MKKLSWLLVLAMVLLPLCAVTATAEGTYTQAPMFDALVESGEKVLDTSGVKLGDKNLGVYAYKQLLLIAYAKKIVSVKVNNDNVFGDGTEKATNELLKRLGYKQNGIAGSGLLKALGEILVK